MAKAFSANDGVLFNCREQLSPHVIGGQTVTFERWMGDGTFSNTREQLEWVPLGQVLVYKTAGVIHCPDILHFHKASPVPSSIFPGWEFM
ncbi:hypothetical protein PILCRDRAFT_819385 [Piloderma croceum F 1598]|uniref:Uncharacterized protein n=1 Tax=Piloderma croceum (strain F 1598) TaxID=765440 RepID=A0A0C3FW31_PILCF|nr:hypothetical protein PILCRDRAFT_819385 [Piloderma croceum F 1598]